MVSLSDSLAVSDYLRHRVQCPKCLLLFRRPPLPSSPVGRFAGWIIGVTVASFIAAMFLLSSKEVASLLPSNPVIAALEEAITAEPRLVAYLLVELLVVIFVSCGIVGVVSNARFRKQFAKQYRVYPVSPRELARSEAAAPPAPPRLPTPEDLAREDREYRKPAAPGAPGARDGAG